MLLAPLTIMSCAQAPKYYYALCSGYERGVVVRIHFCD